MIQSSSRLPFRQTSNNRARNSLEGGNNDDKDENKGKSDRGIRSFRLFSDGRSQQEQEQAPAKSKSKSGSRHRRKDEGNSRRRRHKRNVLKSSKGTPAGDSTEDTVYSNTETDDSHLNPVEFMKELWSERGYNASKTFSTLRSAYYCDPTPLQRASYHPYLLNKVMKHKRKEQRQNENHRDGHNSSENEEEENSRMATIQKMLDLGVSPNACNSRGETLLHSLCRAGRKEHAPVVKLLLDAGASVQVSDEMGQTPLHLACSRTKKQRVQRRKKETKRKMPVPSPPRFDIVDMILSKDKHVLHLTDAHGHTPLSVVPREHWPLWMEYLESRKDEFWPNVEKQPNESGDGDEETKENKLVPPLAKLAPNSKPLPPPSQTLSLRIVSQLVSGHKQPDEVERAQQQTTVTTGGSVSSFSVTRDMIDDDDISLDDSFVGCFTHPNGSEHLDDDANLDVITLGGIALPTLRYAMKTKDYSYNSSSDLASFSSNNNSGSDLSYFSHQTEGETTAEKNLLDMVRTPARRSKSIDSFMIFQDDSVTSGASISSGECTAEKPKGMAEKHFKAKPFQTSEKQNASGDSGFRSSYSGFRSSSTSVLSSKKSLRSSSKLSSALHLPGFGDDWGNSSFSSRFSDAGEASVDWLAEAAAASSSGSDDDKETTPEKPVKTSALDMPGHSLDDNGLDSGGDSIPLLLDDMLSLDGSDSSGVVEYKVEQALDRQELSNPTTSADEPLLVIDSSDEEPVQALDRQELSDPTTTLDDESLLVIDSTDEEPVQALDRQESPDPTTTVDESLLVIDSTDEEPVEDSSSVCSTQSFMRFI